MGGEEDEEPILGRTYLPRKFKIAITVPPLNDVDVFAHEIGLIAIVENGRIAGYNVVVGGGMGMTHGQPDTFPRTGDVIGFLARRASRGCVREDRDHPARLGRPVRSRPRADEIHDRASRSRQVSSPSSNRGSATSWSPRDLTLSIGPATGWAGAATIAGAGTTLCSSENGRVHDLPGRALMSGLRAIAEVHQGSFVITTNQNLIISDIGDAEKPGIERLMEEHGLDVPLSGLRANSMACVALPTCGLALAESERYLPDLVTALEAELERCGLAHDAITIRTHRLPERLRAAVSGGDRVGGARTRALQPVSRRRLQRHAA